MLWTPCWCFFRVLISLALYLQSTTPHLCHLIFDIWWRGGIVFFGRRRSTARTEPCYEQKTRCSVAGGEQTYLVYGVWKECGFLTGKDNTKNVVSRFSVATHDIQIFFLNPHNFFLFSAMKKNIFQTWRFVMIRAIYPHTTTLLALIWRVICQSCPVLGNKQIWFLSNMALSYVLPPK